MGICEKCEWFEAFPQMVGDNKNLRGICRRYPPVATGSFLPNVNRITGEMTPQLMETTIWPNVAAVDRCGEFRVAEKPTQIDGSKVFNMGEPSDTIRDRD